MSDQHDPTTGPSFDGPSFDDPAHDELRALLADARATEPIPAEVADRLDATLVSLQAERRAEGGSDRGTVVPLRRRAGRLLVAAAAVLVVGGGGFAISQGALNVTGSSDDSAMKADSGAAGSMDADTAAPEARADKPGPTSATLQRGLKDLNGTLVPVFTTARFADEAQAYDPATGVFATLDRLQESYAGGTATDSPSDATDEVPGSGPVSGDTASVACAGPQLKDTESVPILLDGATAVLVLHPVTDGTQLVEAWSCDGDTRLTTATVTR